MTHKNSIRKKLQRYRKKQDLQIGMLGNYQYEVEVPGRPNFVYVRLAGQVVSQVYNDRVNPLLDLEVYVGYDDEEPRLLQVLGVRSDLRRYGTGNDTSAYVPEHHKTHEWMNYPVGGNDVVFSELRQLMPLRPTPMPTGVALAINRGILLSNAKDVLYFTGSIIDLGSYIPSTGSRFAYVGIDAFTGLPTVTGGLVRDTLSLTFSDVPDFIIGTYPIGIVRLYENQTKVEETYSSTDLIDLRFPFLPGFLNLYDAPGSYTGHGGHAIFVNPSETGIEFLDLTSAGADGNTGIFVNPMTTLGDMIYSDFGYVAGKNRAVYSLGARVSGSSYTYNYDPSHPYLPDYVLRSDEDIDHWRNFVWSSQGGIGYSFDTAYVIIDLGAAYTIVGWSFRSNPTSGNNVTAGRYTIATAPSYTGSFTTIVTNDAPDSTIFQYVDFSTPVTSRYFKFQGVYPRSGIVGYGEQWIIENISLYESVLGQKPTRLPVGSNGQILTSRNITGALVPDWENFGGDITGSAGSANVWGILGHRISSNTGTGHPVTGDMLRFDGATDTWKLVSGSSANITAFLGLTDTPDTYAGAANKIVAVNSTEVSLEFVSPSSLLTDLITYSENVISNPPTRPELNSIFGDPSSLGHGFLGILNDGGLGNNVYGATPVNSDWHYWSLTKSIDPSSIFTPTLMDDFNDSNGTSLDVHAMDYGNGWTENNGTWEIQSNTARQTSTSVGGVVYIATSDAGIYNFRTRVRIQTGGSLNRYQAGIIFRFVDTSNYWLAYFDAQTATPTVGLEDCVSGSFTVRTSKVWTKKTQQYIDVEVECNGNVISAWFDGGYSVTYTGSFNNTATKIGIWEYQDTNYKTNIFEDFQVAPPPTYPWTRYGTVLSPTVAWEENSVYEPSLLYETNPQILTGTVNVTKIWFSGGGWSGNACLGYAESYDGLTFTKYASNPVISNVWRGITQKYDGIYYYYGVEAPGATTVHLYTSSDGITWAVKKSNTLTLGSTGSWDDYDFGNMFAWRESANDWRLIYESRGSSSDVWKLGYATSTDGETWTKHPSNPVISPDGAAGGAWVKKIDSNYYLFSQRSPQGLLLPSYIYRYRSSNLVSWSEYPQFSIVHRIGTSEGENNEVGQVADPHIIEVSGTSRMYFDATSDGASISGTFHIVLAYANLLSISGW